MSDPRPPEDQAAEATPFDRQRLLERLIDREYAARQDYFDRLDDEMELKDPEMKRRFGADWIKDLYRLEQEGVDAGVLANKQDRVSFSNVEFLQALIYLGDSFETEELEPYLPKIIRNLDMHQALSPKAKDAFRKGDEQDPTYKNTREFIQRLFRFSKEKDGASSPPKTD